jgi:hypothetical protein
VKLQKNYEGVERFRETTDCRNFKKVHRSLLSVLENYGLRNLKNYGPLLSV